MYLFGMGESTSFVVEQEAYNGVKRVAKKVAEDMYLVSDMLPGILEKVSFAFGNAVLFATVGKSEMLHVLQERKLLSVDEVEGKWETYGIRLLTRDDIWDIPECERIENLLVIYGSDKRGTIYGMFHLSELMGVSPLVYWGDARCDKKMKLKLDASVEMVSKEPSVRYRGFFINDEWPCFGKWAFHHFGGFNAKMYDKVFELLLRLKGNYLWPAMWSASFALDGPDEENMRLADEYGIVMGNSHHEPCLRAGEEWDIYRGEESIYGNEWNYNTNKEGLLKYWEDGLKRSGKYESMITVGMRGERDSVLQGPKSLAENIEVLKDIIRNQKQMVEEIVNTKEHKAPMLLAIYKEVEKYFYGNSEVAGLKEWDELKDVILMFCDDNFGHMRYLPKKGENHPGGYGMYYHLDYHGSPISYEWINSTPLSAIWDQMTVAYEHGIKDVWIVNVGDLKGNEYPLSYFMDLAYDFESLGTNGMNGTAKYTRKWLKKQFGASVTEEQYDELTNVLINGTLLLARRRPEALDSMTYHPCNEGEAGRVLYEVKQCINQLKSLEKSLEEEKLPAFYSMIYDNLFMGLNLISMQIYAGKNAHFANQGKVIANRYAEKVRECIKKDRTLIAEAESRNNGKWFGMRSGSHIGFKKWNEDGARYPLMTYVEPFSRPRMLVSRADDTRILLKNYGEHDTIEIRDFMWEGTELIPIEVANDGIGSFQLTVKSEPCEWLEIELLEDQVLDQEYLYLHCNREFLPKEETVCNITLSDKDATVLLKVYGKAFDEQAKGFLENQGIISVLAEHYKVAEFENKDGDFESVERNNVVLQDYGLCGSGIKDTHGNLCLTYEVWAKEEGDFELELWSAPSNPLLPNQDYQYLVANKTTAGPESVISIFEKDYEAGEASCESWSKNVVEQIRKNRIQIRLVKGKNEVTVRWTDTNLILEKLIFYRDGQGKKVSAMGPIESYCKK